MKPFSLVAACALLLGAATLFGRPATAADPTFRSVNVTLPPGDRVFPGGAEADAINANCTLCHSPGMVLTQPALSPAAWKAEIDKMRDTYKAPIAAEDAPAILAYLAAMKVGP